MNAIEKLTELFKEFPGIGPRQAQRFVYFLLRKNAAYVGELSRLITEAKREVKQCTSCMRYFQPKFNNGSQTGGAECHYCSDSSRDRSRLMIVTRDSDFYSIEKSDAFDGLYFILGGTIPALEKKPERLIYSNELKNIVEKRISSDGLSEIIIALNATTDGDYTTDYLKKELETFDVTISTLGRGLSTGSELEYADKKTIAAALENRH